MLNPSDAETNHGKYLDGSHDTMVQHETVITLVALHYPLRKSFFFISCEIAK